MNNNTATDSQRSEFKSKFVSGNSNEEIAVSLNYLSKFWRILKMPILICEINLILTYQKFLLFLMHQGQQNLK